MGDQASTVKYPKTAQKMDKMISNLEKIRVWCLFEQKPTLSPVRALGLWPVHNLTKTLVIFSRIWSVMRRLKEYNRDFLLSLNLLFKRWIG